jgi:hypothetical protein
MQNTLSSATESQRSDIFDVPSDGNESRQLGVSDGTDSLLQRWISSSNFEQNSTATKPTPTTRILKKPSGSQTTKVGSKKSHNNKPSPKSKKGSPQNSSKAASKRPLESPSNSPKRRRTATYHPDKLLGKEAEAALEQYDREEVAEHDRLEEGSDEDNERSIEQEDPGNLPRRILRPFLVPRPRAPGLPNGNIQPLHAPTHQIDIGTQAEVGRTRTGFIAPLAPMTTSSPRNTLHAPTSLPTPPAQSPPASQRAHEAIKPTPKVRGLFWIIAHPQPNKRIRSQWKNGQFKGKRLSTVIDEISSFLGTGPIEELNLKLETFLDETHVTVHRDDEKFWEETQRDFQKQIKDAFTRDSDRGSQYKIWIEPVYAENGDAGRNDDGDSEDFDW